MSRSLHSCTKSYKSMYRAELGFVMCSVQMVSAPHHYLKAMFLGHLLGVGKASGFQGLGMGDSGCWGSAHRSAGGHVHQMTLFNNVGLM